MFAEQCRIERSAGIELLRFASAFVLATFALALNTTGFDFYVHAQSMMSWDYIPQRNSFRGLTGGLLVPRYLLGHHILFLLTLGVIPLAWVVITIHALLLVACLRRLRELAWYLMPLLGVFFAYNFIFMSMTNIGASFLLLAVLSRRTGRGWWPWFFLGAAFHPVTLVLAVILGFLFLPWGRALMALCSVVILSHMLAISYPESVTEVRMAFDGVALQADLMSRLIVRIILFFKFFGIGVLVYCIIRLGSRRIRIRLPVPGALAVAAFLIAGASVKGWEAQFQRGSAISYIGENKTLGTVESDKYQLICAAWITRSCYDGLGEERGFDFRQKTLR